MNHAGCAGNGFVAKREPDGANRSGPGINAKVENIISIK
jgi:hypothetical protein